MLGFEEELDDEDEPDDGLEALLDVDCGAFGVKKLLPAPNPILGALAPPTSMVAVWFFAVSTSLPEVSSQAVTCALPKVFLLMALSRSPTVSLPVDL